MLGIRQLPESFQLLCARAGAIAVCLFFPLLLPFIASGQSRLQHFDHIGTKEGLSGETITALCQDRRGFIWIGTHGQGLNRFDGNEIKIWRHSKRNSFSICSDVIRSILEDDNGMIWVGTAEGISRLNPYSGHCENYPATGEPIYDAKLFLDFKREIWVASGKGLWRYIPDSNHFVRCRAVNESQAFSNSAGSSDGWLWLSYIGLTGLNQANDSCLHFLPFPEAPPTVEKNLTNLKIDSYGNIWVTCWGGGLHRFHPKTGQFERFIWNKTPKIEAISNIVFDLEETYDEEGKRIFWICAENGVFRFPLEAHDFPSLDKPHDFLQPAQGGQVWRLITDHHGDLWFGATNGLYRRKKEQDYIRLLSLPRETYVEQVNFLPDGETILSSSFNNPMIILDAQLGLKKKFHNLPPETTDGAGTTSWAAALDEKADILYAATFHGLVAYHRKSEKFRWYRWNPKDSTGLAGPKVTGIVPLGNGQLLLSFWRQGAQVFDTRSGKGLWRFQEAHGNNIRCMKRIDGVIWVGSEWALYTFDPNSRSMTEMTAPAEHGVQFFDILKTQKGGIWLATNQGLMQFDADKHQVLEKYTPEDGVEGSAVNTLAEDLKGRLWLGTTERLILFNPNGRKFYQFDKELLPAGSVKRAPDGKFWCISGNQVRILNPDWFQAPRPSQVYITGLKINQIDTLLDAPFEQIDQIRLQPGQDALTFSYTAIDLGDFGKTNFRYKLEGLQTAWVHAGKNRQADFVNLHPGVYTFRVRPEDAGDDDAYDATLKVIVTDYFWQRSWFKLLVFALLIGSVISLLFLDYTRRLRARNELLRAQLAVEDERNRISRDLHDDIGSGLGAIRLLSDMANSTADDKVTLRARMAKIATSARELSEKIHEIIWAANPKNDSMRHLIYFLQQYAVSLFGDSNYNLRAFIPENMPIAKISGEQRRAVFLVYKEALHNIVKHANATCIVIDFEVKRRQLRICVRDNGNGFDPAAVGDSGNGLVNMEKRMKDIGGVFHIASGKEGTTVFIEMDCGN